MRSRKAKRGVYYAKKCVEPVNYRSGWELQFAQWLDASPTVASYRYEPYAIEYVSNARTGKVRRYWPDFEVTWVAGHKTLVEVKPKKKVTQARNVKKATAARLYAAARGMEYTLITEVDLKRLGLL